MKRKDVVKLARLEIAVDAASMGLVPAVLAKDRARLVRLREQFDAELEDDPALGATYRDARQAEAAVAFEKWKVAEARRPTIERYAQRLALVARVSPPVRCGVGTRRLAPGRPTVRRRQPTRGPPGGDEPPLDPVAWRGTLRRLIDRAARDRAARLDAWRVCSACQREQEPEEFSAGCYRCKSCEAERLRDTRRKREAAA
jgi:hypothetical protein